MTDGINLHINAKAPEMQNYYLQNSISGSYHCPNHKKPVYTQGDECHTRVHQQKKAWKICVLHKWIKEHKRDCGRMRRVDVYLYTACES